MIKAYLTTLSLLFLLVALLCNPLTTEAAVFSSELRSLLQSVQGDEEISVLVSLSDKVDIRRD